MNNNFQTEQELAKHFSQKVAYLNRIPADSPVSFAARVNEIIGYYKGYCDARGWLADFTLIGEWMDLT